MWLEDCFTVSPAELLIYEYDYRLTISAFMFAVVFVDKAITMEYHGL